MQTTSETNLRHYDFALSDDLNEKLQRAVMLLDEVRFRLADGGEDYTQEFRKELSQGTKRITDAVGRLDQAPVIQQQVCKLETIERDKEFADCVSEVEALLNLIEGCVVKERRKDTSDERKRRMDSLRSTLVSGFSVISGTSVADTEDMFAQVRQDHQYQCFLEEKRFLTECSGNRITFSVLGAFLDAYGYLWHQCYAEGRIDASVMESAKRNVSRYVRRFGWKIYYGKMKYKIVTASRLVLRGGYDD